MRLILKAAAAAMMLSVAACEEPADMDPLPEQVPPTAAEAGLDAAGTEAEADASAAPAPTDTPPQERELPTDRDSAESVQPDSDTLFY
ncbi:hypothetical protein Q0812_03840 [Brevundimonas sp. 2R-24]|uniref:Uncharacterized protein n=1 Tax=Peiella sedimenti TaxID=3061083 RepID=A0ABT8SL47_9CAUL|nr:hypothetical protein [Caulobacteraceae bacterium XZ-24]